MVDECHRATGKADIVLAVKRMRDAGVKFRVLGLSATPGRDRESVQVRRALLCCQMFLTALAVYLCPDEDQTHHANLHCCQGSESHTLGPHRYGGRASLSTHSVAPLNTALTHHDVTPQSGVSAQEVMDNLMIARLEFRAEEDAEVAAHTFKKHLTTKVSRPLLMTHRPSASSSGGLQRTFGLIYMDGCV